MGTKCSCLYSHDKYNSNVNGLNIKTEKPEKKICMSNPEAKLIEITQYDINIVTKIQSTIRGYLSRKKNKISSKLGQHKNSNNAGKTKQQTVWNEVDFIPEYANEEVLNAEKKLQPFNYSLYNFETTEKIIDKPPMKSDMNSVYVGQWNEKGQRNGKGIQYWPDGSKYEGYWKNDMANGYGRLIHLDGDSYIGNWVNDMAQGFGEYINSDGSKYIGEWVEDKQHGKGEEICQDGSCYKGDYCMGKKHGKGLFLWKDSSSYDGEFKDNEIEGKGTYKWADKRMYSGDWVGNKMNGKGVFTWPDGKKYVGEYLDDKKHGYGEFFWPDGNKYAGNWENGKQHGRGILTGNDGKSREGEWKEGIRVRWINTLRSEGNKEAEDSRN